VSSPDTSPPKHRKTRAVEMAVVWTKSVVVEASIMIIVVRRKDLEKDIEEKVWACCDDGIGFITIIRRRG